MIQVKDLAEMHGLAPDEMVHLAKRHGLTLQTSTELTARQAKGLLKVLGVRSESPPSVPMATPAPALGSRAAPVAWGDDGPVAQPRREAPSVEAPPPGPPPIPIPTLPNEWQQAAAAPPTFGTGDSPAAPNWHDAAASALSGAADPRPSRAPDGVRPRYPVVGAGQSSAWTNERSGPEAGAANEIAPPGTNPIVADNSGRRLLIMFAVVAVLVLGVVGFLALRGGDDPTDAPERDLIGTGGVDEANGADGDSQGGPAIQQCTPEKPCNGPPRTTVPLFEFDTVDGVEQAYTVDLESFCTSVLPYLTQFTLLDDAVTSTGDDLALVAEIDEINGTYAGSGRSLFDVVHPVGALDGAWSLDDLSDLEAEANRPGAVESVVTERLDRQRGQIDSFRPAVNTRCA